MKHGDFTNLAKFYGNRPGYSITLLQCLKNHIENSVSSEDTQKIADIGAGTGKLTENLAEIGCTGYAVEPNDAMRAEGENNFKEQDTFLWQKGSAEQTFLGENSVKWALMGSSFHWTDSEKAAEEFYRILVPGGFFTAIWNPRDIESSELHRRIEDAVYGQIPGMKRVSSGRTVSTEEMTRKLLGKGLFKNIMLMESPHVEVMSKERYMNSWKSVNDIQVQAGEEGFQKILQNIERIIESYDEIEVPYLSRAWTVQSCKK